MEFDTNDEPAALIARLMSSGHFVNVAYLSPDRGVRFAQANNEPLAFNPGQLDPHRHQWALEAIRAPGPGGAWHYTLGRAQVGSIDGGILVGHPDVPDHAFANLRKHQSARFRRFDLGSQSRDLLVVASPDNELGADRGFQSRVHHGQHVNSIMVAPRNVVPTGIAGVCPECTLQTFRGDDLVRLDPNGNFFAWSPLLTARLGQLSQLLGNFGTTAVNMSIRRFQGDFAPGFAASLQVLADRDVVLVASAGNEYAEIACWTCDFPVQLPHGVNSVLKVGATDRDNHLWYEPRIAQLPFGRRHPVKQLDQVSTVQGFIIDRCTIGEPFQREECGSNYGASANIIDVVAPGAQVVAALSVGGRTDAGPQGVYNAVPLDPSNDLGGSFYVDASPTAPGAVSLGVSSSGVQVNTGFTAYGPLTGTSMAAPHVTATVGLMRSLNPLLSAQVVRTSIRSSADSSPNNVPGYTPERMGGGLLNARAAMEQTAGKIRDVSRRNRLTPVFAMYAANAQLASETLQGEEVSTAVINSWLYTTNAQLASAAMAGDIYTTPAYDGKPVTGPNQPPPPLGAIGMAAYIHIHELPGAFPAGIPVPTSVYQLPSGAGAGRRQPGASFYVFTTPHSPLPNTTLQPLYRLTTRYEGACAGDQRKHLYTTRQTEAQGFINNAPSCGAGVFGLSYHFESIEGYVFDREGPQPPGTFALFRGLNTSLNVSALIVDGEQQRSPYIGYAVNSNAVASNPDFLGWVYRTFKPQPGSPTTFVADDFDSDGLIDGLERAFSLNENAPNGDCDAVADRAEYGFAELPSDPMTPSTTCGDPRLSWASSSLQQGVLTIANPVGPATLPANTIVQLTYPATGNCTSSGFPPVPPSCSVVQPGLPIYTVYHCTLSSLAVGATTSLNLPRACQGPNQANAALLLPGGWTDPSTVSDNSVVF